jgi:hypothetical protein
MNIIRINRITLVYIYILHFNDYLFILMIDRKEKKEYNY